MHGKVILVGMFVLDDRRELPIATSGLLNQSKRS